MKIALIGQKGIPSRYGGVEKHVEELATRLKNDGFEIDVYASAWYTLVSLKSYKGINIIHMPSLKTKHFDAITRTFFASVHSLFGKNDIIHYHGVGPALMAWIPRLFSNAKVVVTFHCIDRFHQKWGVIARFALRVGEWCANFFAHETIAVSKTIAQYCFLEYKNQATYIPNGISEQNIITEPEYIKDMFGLEKNEYFLMVSRLVRHKAPHTLIQAYLKLNTNKKLVIVGGSVFTDDYVLELKELAKNNKNIIFTDFQSGIILDELYSNAYAFVHPSVSEGLPICVLEAMSYGKCVIASDIPENLEVTRNNGISFESGNVNDLENKLIYALQNPDLIKKQGEVSKDFVLKFYHWDNVAKKTIELYKKIRYASLEANKLKIKSTL